MNLIKIINRQYIGFWMLFVFIIGLFGGSLIIILCSFSNQTNIYAKSESKDESFCPISCYSRMPNFNLPLEIYYVKNIQSCNISCYSKHLVSTPAKKTIKLPSCCFWYIYPRVDFDFNRQFTILTKKIKLNKIPGLSLPNNFLDHHLLTINNCPNLQVLDLSQCDKITDKGISYLTRLKKLSILELDHCYKITDNGIKSLSSLKSLQILRLSHCYLISDKGLKTIGNLSELRILDLSFCNKISDKGISFLSNLNKLVELRLDGCKKITDKSFEYIAKLKKLKYLYIGSCYGLTGSGLNSIAEMKELLKLSLSFCDNIKGRYLQYLSNIKSLKELYLFGYYPRRTWGMFKSFDLITKKLPMCSIKR